MASVCARGAPPNAGSRACAADFVPRQARGQYIHAHNTAALQDSARAVVRPGASIEFDVESRRGAQGSLPKINRGDVCGALAVSLFLVYPSPSRPKQRTPHLGSSLRSPAARLCERVSSTSLGTERPLNCQELVPFSVECPPASKPDPPPTRAEVSGFTTSVRTS